ncbi:MAG: GNAT family N-acetyltransferase [Methanosarcinaceae archaeon]|nr:GNAT family N-acetyltransferase [Methanosarcinaceae archaeon]
MSQNELFINDPAESEIFKKLNIYYGKISDGGDIDLLLSFYFLDRDNIPYDDFIIARLKSGKTVGVISNKENEVHTIAVHPSYKNKGIGKILLYLMTDKIKKNYPDKKIIFTKTTSPDFFLKCGFVSCKNDFKKEFWNECRTCDKFDICTQKVLIYKL